MAVHTIENAGLRGGLGHKPGVVVADERIGDLNELIAVASE